MPPKIKFDSQACDKTRYICYHSTLLEEKFRKNYRILFHRTANVLNDFRSEYQKTIDNLYSEHQDRDKRKFRENAGKICTVPFKPQGGNRCQLKFLKWNLIMKL